MTFRQRLETLSLPIFQRFRPVFVRAYSACIFTKKLCTFSVSSQIWLQILPISLALSHLLRHLFYTKITENGARPIFEESAVLIASAGITLTHWYPPGGTYRWASQWIPHWWACPPWWLPGSRRPYSAYEGHKKTLHCNICQALIGFSQRHYNISLQGLWFTKFTYPQLFINFHTTSLLLPYSIDTTLNQLSYNFLSEIQTNVPCH